MSRDITVASRYFESLLIAFLNRARKHVLNLRLSTLMFTDAQKLKQKEEYHFDFTLSLTYVSIVT